MRIQAIHAVLLAAILAALSWGAHAADDAAPSVDLDDLDDDELEGDGDGDGAGGAAYVPFEVEDFDASLTEVQQKERMKACFLYTMRRAKVRGPQLQDAVKEMMAQKEQEMTQEQAINTIIFSWMMTCYMNIEETNMKTAYTADALEEAVEAEVFMPKPENAQQINQASQRQWKLLENVLLEETGKHAKDKMPEQQQQQQQSSSQSYESTPGGASTEAPKQKFGMMYVLCAFGAVFGLSAFIITRLNGNTEKPEKERSSKSLKKEEKAKRELARKQR